MILFNLEQRKNTQRKGVKSTLKFKVFWHNNKHASELKNMAIPRRGIHKTVKGRAEGTT